MTPVELSIEVVGGSNSVVRDEDGKRVWLPTPTGEPAYAETTTYPFKGVTKHEYHYLETKFPGDGVPHVEDDEQHKGRPLHSLRREKEYPGQDREGKSVDFVVKARYVENIGMLNG